MRFITAAHQRRGAVRGSEAGTHPPQEPLGRCGVNIFMIPSAKHILIAGLLFQVAFASEPGPPRQMRALGSRELEARATSCVGPRFPAQAREAKIEGYVGLSLLVGVEGNVLHVDPIRRRSILIGSAVDAARQWTFRPIVLNGKAIEYCGTLEFHYATSGERKQADSCLEAR